MPLFSRRIWRSIWTGPHGQFKDHEGVRNQSASHVWKIRCHSNLVCIFCLPDDSKTLNLQGRLGGRRLRPNLDVNIFSIHWKYKIYFGTTLDSRRRHNLETDDLLIHRKKGSRTPFVHTSKYSNMTYISIRGVIRDRFCHRLLVDRGFFHTFSVLGIFMF